MKSFPSKVVRALRLGLKRGCARAIRSFGSKSYTLFAVPSGLSESKSITQVVPEKNVIWDAPKSIESPLLWKGGAAQALAQGYFHVKGGIATHLGGNLDRSGKLITTYLVPVDGKTPANHDLFNFSSKRFFPRITHADRVISLAAGWHDMFYHWMYEVLPRLFLVKELPGMIYIDQGKAFQKESLALFGIEKGRLIDASKWNAVRTKELIVPSIPNFATKWVCDFLRDNIHVRKLDRRRLYISRSDAQKRRILNEEELLPILEKHGFECRTLSDLPFLEQTALFKSAEIVVGPHGAGFSHLAFCEPGTPLLEIFAPSYTHQCYWQIANAASLPYHYMLGEGKGGVETDPDIVVDPKKFEKALIYALADRQ
ncbi:MAG: glycosyltransferase family 61 protein [Chlamydiales bacterium]|nr:glycosyltransferase family 61 protein [Chlamydiales bacterium]